MCDTNNISVHQGRGRECAVKHKKRMKQLTKGERKQTVEDRLGRIEEDLSVVVGTLGDLQDRFEELLNRVMDRDEDEEQVVGEAPPTYATAEVQCSNVTGSPYKYLYIYLTSRMYEGPHIIISDAREFQDEPGICVGKYPHYEGEGNNVVVQTIDEAIDMVGQWVEGASAPTA